MQQPSAIAVAMIGSPKHGGVPQGTKTANSVAGVGYERPNVGGELVARGLSSKA
jgi:hypothetical protein